MKIIKQGKLPGETEMRGECMNCRCQVTFLQKEATSTFDRSTTIYKIKCPTPGCGHEIFSSK